jgi:hypothetical protein
MKHLLFLLILVSSATYAQVYQPVTGHFNSTPTYGVKIKTNMPFTPSSHMPTIIIEGYNYGTGDAIGIMINYYLYSTTPADPATYYFIKHNATSYGGYTPVIKLANENNKIVIFIDSKDYFLRFMVRAFSKGLSEQTSWFDGWTVVDEALTGTAQVTVPYRNRFKNEVLIDGRASIKSGSLGGIGFTNSANNYVNSISSVTGADSTQAHLVFRTGTANASVNSLPERMRVDKDGNVGIGTSAPTSKLDVNGVLTLSSASGSVNSIGAGISVNGNARTMRFGYNSTTSNEGFQFYNLNNSTSLMMIQGNGNVGIGLTTPSAKLEVRNISSAVSQTNPLISARGIGNNFEFGHYNPAGYSSTLGTESYSGRPFLCFNCEAGTMDNKYRTRGKIGTIITADLLGGLILGRIENSNADNQNLTTDFILKGGQVGIGTSNIPIDFKLAVAGNLIAEKIKVKKQVGGVWPDYVFSPTYRLPSLNEIEAFTKKNNHLPEIPSAKEIENDGQDLGEMNRLLLKKVEELTLYLIEQNKSIIQQSKEIKELKLKVDQLEKK